jgi:hypothetical protein
MTYPTLARFAASIHEASRNALIIFLLAFAAFFGYQAISYIVPDRWRPFAKLTAWIYALIVLAVTILISAKG